MRVLCVAPHPDDESIGCGGTLVQHAAAGADVHVVWVTSGEAGGEDDPSTLATRREAEALAAAHVLRTTSARFLRLPDAGLSKLEWRLADAIGQVLEDVRPDVVYAPHRDDGHDDHAAVAAATVEALSSLPSDAQAWGYEVWTPIARPLWCNVIDDTLRDKIAAIRCHTSQLEHIAFEEAARALARYRGELHCWPHGTFAEAFAELPFDACEEA